MKKVNWSADITTEQAKVELAKWKENIQEFVNAPENKEFLEYIPPNSSRKVGDKSEVGYLLMGAGLAITLEAQTAKNDDTKRLYMAARSVVMEAMSAYDLSHRIETGVATPQDLEDLRIAKDTANMLRSLFQGGNIESSEKEWGELPPGTVLAPPSGLKN